MPPRIQRAAVAVEMHGHAFRERVPVCETRLWHGDNNGNVRAQRALDQIGQAFAVAFLAAEAVDDDEVGAHVDRGGHVGTGGEQLAEIEFAASRASGTAMTTGISALSACSIR